ncbi:hypothetical protein [Natronosalvus caseinilyticus]|uniref:hypothetical protein n=1 Tax=Natronosalvus caseinilyticus TaxID=2953747 RepID=UPI0028A6E813|nr:hypothetical protein [Natronosalvus caseinilyticus]
MSEVALEAKRGDESVKESVQGYRRKLYRLKKEQEATEEVLEHITSKDHITREDMVRFMHKKSNDVMQSASADVSLLEARIDELREDIEETRDVLRCSPIMPAPRSTGRNRTRMSWT